ncbi:PE-PPE domain-containing protein [Mycolicibacterium sediminis]|nr:PE-PPE domain-containing protein [Mycolicibacterium sediminis]
MRRAVTKIQTHGGILARVAAAGLAVALVVGLAGNPTPPSVDVVLGNSVIGAGGKDDGPGARLPAKFNGTVIPDGYAYVPIDYPATIDLAGSRDLGAASVIVALRGREAEADIVVLGYSEGALVAERARRDLQAKRVGPFPDVDPDEWAPPADQLRFVMIGSPFAPNGGMFGRFAGFSVPTVIDTVGPSAPTRYDTVYEALEYDPYADFPAYFNPLALLNSAIAVRYAHPDAAYDPIDRATTPKIQKTVRNAAGGTDTYVLYRNPRLPLLAPLRDLAAHGGVAAFTDPVLDAVEPLLRRVVDMAYTDRTYANVDKDVRFSLITPPGRIIEALRGEPDSFTTGATGGPLSSAGTAPNRRTAPAEAAEPAATPTVRQPDSGSSGRTDRARILRPTLTSGGNKATPAGVAGGPVSTTGAGGLTVGPGASSAEPGVGGTASVTSRGPSALTGTSAARAGVSESEPGTGGAGLAAA